MALAKDSTLKAGITTMPRPGFRGVIGDQYHPGGQGNNIYQLLRVIRDGVPHLVGSISKGNGSIIDFTTGEVLYDFSQFGAGPRLGNDSYGAACAWTNPADGITRYYFGGWIKAPANVPVSGQQDHTNKYSYVVETADFVDWRIVLSDVAQAADSWQAEVSDLIPTNNALYILRGDGQQGSAPLELHTGVYKYTGGANATTPPGYLGGGTVTRINSDAVISGTLYWDELIISKLSTATPVRIDPETDATLSAVPYTNVPIAGGVGATRSEPGVLCGTYGNLRGLLFRGSKSGYWIGDIQRDTGATRFVPLFIGPHSTSGAADRVVGWRSPVRQVEGGIVVAVNPEIGTADTPQAFLVWIGPGGTVKVLSVGGFFGGIEVFDDRLYYGVSSGAHAGPILNYKLDNPTLGSMPLDAIHGRKPPAYAENITQTGYLTGVGPISSAGFFGGYPTLGYTRATLIFKASASGNLAPVTINPAKSSVGTLGRNTYGNVAVTGGTITTVDLTPYLDGGLLGFTYSANADIEARISFQ